MGSLQDLNEQLDLVKETIDSTKLTCDSSGFRQYNHYPVDRATMKLPEKSMFCLETTALPTPREWVELSGLSFYCIWFLLGETMLSFVWDRSRSAVFLSHFRWKLKSYSPHKSISLVRSSVLYFFFFTLKNDIKHRILSRNRIHTHWHNYSPWGPPPLFKLSQRSISKIN